MLDFDVKKGGLETLELLDDLGLPQSYRVRTPSGGMHVYLAVDDAADIPNSVNKADLYPGMDVRSLGGLVVGAGSEIDGRFYEEV